MPPRSWALLTTLLLTTACATDSGPPRKADASDTGSRITLSISLDEEHWGSSMSEVYKSIQPHVPQGIYPFAATGAGDFICFDYRRSQSAPSVVFYFAEAEGEEAIYPIAGGFTEFLSKLHD